MQKLINHFILNLLRLFCLISFVLISIPTSFASETFSYSGRLVHTNGSPVPGRVNLTFDLAYSDQPGVILCTEDLNNVDLVNGVFHVKLGFGSCNLSNVLANISNGQTLNIRVTDRTPDPDRIYSFQSIHSVPQSIMSQMSKQLVQMDAVDGQVLTWRNGKWGAEGPTGATSGTVTQITATDGLSGGIITNTGTIGILDNGVTSSKILDDTIVDTDISSTAEIAQSKIKNLTTDLAAKESSIGTGTSTDYLDGTKAWNNFDQSVRNTLLIGYTTGSATPIAATDNVMEAIGKLEGQIIANDTAFDNAGQWDKDGSLLFYNSGNVGIGTATPSDKLEVVGDLALSGKLRLKNSALSYVELKAPVGAGAITYTLPGTLGSNGQILSTDNLGNLSWLTPSTDSSQITDGSIVDADISASANIAQSKISGLATSLGNKQDVIATSDTTTYYRGDKTWQTLTTDAVPEGSKLYFTEPLVLGTDLAGFTSGPGIISASDTLLTAINKLDGNISAVSSAQANYVLKAGDTMTGPLGVVAPTADDHAANKLYVDTQTALSASKWTASGSDIYYSSGNVAIGTNAPAGQLHLFNTTSGLTPKAEADNLVIEDATGAGLSFLTENGFSHVVDFGFRDTTNGDFEYARIEGVRPAAGLIALRQPQLNFKFMSDGVTELVPLNIKKNMVTIDSPLTLSTANGGTINGVKSLTHDGGGSVGMVIGGSSNVISDHNYSVIVGGGGNTISAGLGTDSSSIFGGIGSTVTGSQSIAMGLSMNVSGYRSFGIGLDFSTPAYSIAQDNTMAIMGGNVGIGTTTPQSKLDVKGTLLLSGATSGYVGLAPAAVAGSTIYTLPSSDGSAGDLLKTNGAGVLSWQAPQSTTPTGAAGGDLSGTYPNPTITGLDAIKISDGSIDNTEFGYLDGVTSNLQTQLNAKEATITAGTIDQYWAGTKSWRDFDADVRSALLSAYSVTAGVVASGDGIQTAISKLDGNIASLQANGQWTKNSTNIYYNSGYVGIGTNDPSMPLHIASTGWGTILAQKSSNDNSGAEIHFYKSRGTPSAMLPVLANDRLMGLYGAGAYSSTQLTDNVAGIQMMASENFTSTAQGTLIDFGTTATGTTTRLTRMTISPEGNVGIGTTSPEKKFHLENGVALITGTATAYQIRETDTIDQNWQMGVNGGALRFATQNDALNSASEKVTILNNGNVGIGNNNPAQKLHVANGNVELSLNYALGTSLGSLASEMALYPSFSGINALTGLGPSSPHNVGMILKSDQAIGFVETDGNSLVGYMDVNTRDFIWDGKVGIGTTTPAAPLDIAVKAVENPSSPAAIFTRAADENFQMLAMSGSSSNTNGSLIGKLGMRYMGGMGVGDTAILRFYRGGTNLDGKMAIATNDLDRLTVAANGYVGIGTTAPAYKLDVRGGNVNSEGAITNVSDRRLKENILPLDSTLEKILQLESVSYVWKDRSFDPSKQVGFIAQDVEKVFPEVVKTDSKGFKAMSYSQLISPVVKAIQELYTKWSDDHDEIEKLKNENAVLKAQNEEILKRLDRLEQERKPASNAK